MSARANTTTPAETPEARYYDLCRELADELCALQVGIDTALTRPGIDDDERAVYERLQRCIQVELLGLELGAMPCSRAELPAHLAWAVGTREQLGALSWPQAVALSEAVDELRGVTEELLERRKVDTDLGDRLAAAESETDFERRTALVRSILIDEGHGELLRRMAEHDEWLRAAEERGRRLRTATRLCKNGGW